MKKTLLEDLWFSYEIENYFERDERETEISKKLDEHELFLRSELSKEQKRLLENLQDCIYAINDIHQEKAFARGVCFATKFLFEALHKD